jgi:hypothetical protein
MKVIHILRKPCSEGTVAANVLRHGTGALNVDATRIGTTDNLNGGAYAKNASERHDKAENWRYKRGDRGGLAETPFTQPTGRWPANLVLQHLDGCVQDGVREVRSNGHYPARRPSGSTVTSGHKGQEGLVEAHTDGESVAAWACEEGCPVAALDAQSGTLTSGTRSPSHARTAPRPRRIVYGEYKGTQAREFLGDTGGASRFFKQVGGVTKPPTDG